MVGISVESKTNMKMGLSLMNNSTADRFPNIWFITKKKNTPTLQKKNKNKLSLSCKCPF